MDEFEGSDTDEAHRPRKPTTNTITSSRPNNQVIDVEDPGISRFFNKHTGTIYGHNSKKNTNTTNNNTANRNDTNENKNNNDRDGFEFHFDDEPSPECPICQQKLSSKDVNTHIDKVFHMTSGFRLRGREEW